MKCLVVEDIGMGSFGQGRMVVLVRGRQLFAPELLFGLLQAKLLQWYEFCCCQRPMREWCVSYIAFSWGSRTLTPFFPLDL